MDMRNTTQQAPPTTSTGMDHSEEMHAELDEPPEEVLSRWSWSPTKHSKPSGFGKLRPVSGRRESLLTRQIQSETEHTDEEHSPPPRTLSTQSTWSNPSTASMAELTSDDGHSVASPAVSPPLPPTQLKNALPVTEKPLEMKVKIAGQDHVVSAAKSETSSEKTVEANLGRKRCISFACKGKQDTKPSPPPTSEPAKPASPPKRKCMLTFVCPSKNDAKSKPVETAKTKRPVSPPPPERRSSASTKHRGSDSTVTHVSPKSVRKTQVVTETAKTRTEEVVSPTLARKYSNDSDEEDECGESVRFHEFAASEGEPEDWVRESTCHRSRLTIDDTLKKENYIRKACEDVEDALNEEEEEAEEEELEEELAFVHDSEGEMEDDVDDEDESDDGFHSDDEEGFASSDSEDDSDSDFEWWKPGGGSTAATSMEQLDRLAIVNSKQAFPSSVGSASSSHMSPLARQVSVRKSANSRTPAVTIQREDVDLPDSTDFVCGTLDEDRPLEQAYLNRIKSKEGKRKICAQDIDPTFPTSDPEMDEEDDDDVDEVEESEEEEEETFMHGDLDEIHGSNTGIKKISPRMRVKSNAHYSPPPSAARHHSPPPTRRGTCRSPPPPTKRTRAPSPAPRKLFGHSPQQRAKSPAPAKRMTSPPNSPAQSNVQLGTAPQGLAGRPRPQLTHTASLPRGGGATLSNLVAFNKKNVDSDSDTTAINVDVPRRGAIDIVKGLEKKRQRRKEKLWQKFCAKAAAKGEKTHKVKPGKGAERMREVGLQLQQYHGKAEHILSL